MKRLLKEHWREVLKIGLVVVLMSFAAVYLSSWLRTDYIRQKVQASGFLGQIIVILYITTSQVIAPLAGTPGAVVGLSVYGLYKGWLLI
ncbi:hypothetical protein ACFL1Q_02915 [Patescibacteria group bacterium]